MRDFVVLIVGILFCLGCKYENSVRNLSAQASADTKTTNIRREPRVDEQQHFDIRWAPQFVGAECMRWIWRDEESMAEDTMQRETRLSGFSEGVDDGIKRRRCMGYRNSVKKKVKSDNGRYDTS